MDARSLAEIVAAQQASDRPYLEFIRSESMSAGLYVLDAGAVDGQSPHTEDEIYVVLAGKASFSAGDETRPVAMGDTIYVPAGVEHRFRDIAEQLRLIVVFAPSECRRRP